MPYCKDSPVLSKAEKTTGKIFRKHLKANHYPSKDYGINRILSSASPPPAKNNEPRSLLDEIRGKNLEPDNINKQLFPKIKLTYTSNPNGPLRNNAMKSDLTRVFPVKFKLKNQAFSEQDKISPSQLTNNYDPGNDQADRRFEGNKTDLSVSNNPEPPDNAENKKTV